MSYVVMERLNHWIDEAYRENEWSDLMDVRYRIEALTAENERLREEKDRLVTFVNNLIEDVGLEYDGMRLQ